MRFCKFGNGDKVVMVQPYAIAGTRFVIGAGSIGMALGHEGEDELALVPVEFSDPVVLTLKVYVPSVALDKLRKS